MARAGVTETNVFALHDAICDGRGRVARGGHDPGRAQHLRRCLTFGLLAPDARGLVLTRAGREALYSHVAGAPLSFVFVPGGATWQDRPFYPTPAELRRARLELATGSCWLHADCAADADLARACYGARPAARDLCRCALAAVSGPAALVGGWCVSCLIQRRPDAVWRASLPRVSP